MAKALVPTRVVATLWLYKVAYAGRCALHTPPQISTHRASASAMKMSSWLKKTKNDHEASVSRRTRRSSRPPSLPPSVRPWTVAHPPLAFLHQLPPAPRPKDYVGWGRPSTCLPLPCGSTIGATCCSRSINHHDVFLPNGWHLNCPTVPVPPAPLAGPKLDAEIHRCIRNFPQALREDRQYQNR
jgi:hypothetical protein